jgi:hypothetical protein
MRLVVVVVTGSGIFEFLCLYDVVVPHCLFFDGNVGDVLWMYVRHWHLSKMVRKLMNQHHFLWLL